MNKHETDECIKMPLQPIRNGRFVPNKIVRMLLDTGTVDLNKIACMNFTREEQEQFAQLIGYSLGGFSELSYVSDETYEAAVKIAEGENENELEARNAVLRETLDEIRRGLKIATCMAFRIHQDDLTI